MLGISLHSVFCMEFDLIMLFVLCVDAPVVGRQRKRSTEDDITEYLQVCIPGVHSLAKNMLIA